MAYRALRLHGFMTTSSGGDGWTTDYWQRGGCRFYAPDLRKRGVSAWRRLTLFNRPGQTAALRRSTPPRPLRRGARDGRLATSTEEHPGLARDLVAHSTGGLIAAAFCGWYGADGG